MRCADSILFLAAIVAFSVAVATRAPHRYRTVTAERRREPFKTYWNVPTFQCRSHKLNFTALTRKYNILQNENDDFRGAVVAILYDPGAFPAILKSASGSRTVLRNGGVPQEGNLTLHLDLFRKTVEELIPDKDFAGVGVIDFESWRPIFRQNFGTLTPYKQLSVDIEKQTHPLWPEYFIEKLAQRRFELFGRIFMEETLLAAKSMRPAATWGYYAYPYCFNMNSGSKHAGCPNEVAKENDVTEWLFRIKDNFHPSLYLREKNLTAKERLQLIIGRIDESHRIIEYMKRPRRPLIVPYFWYKYQDSNEFLSKEDIYNSLHTLKNLNVDALILWGSSNDVNTGQKCQELYKYVDAVLGPALLTL